ncbi:N-acetyl-alpha-D-glucosaminyl L-malate synthase BshA [Desulfuribacillus alkaliarsenatis]|uniref:N-acetyl-alpha-D-glucosaminyl L-malate synthase BshA n=1 Tax=Desulfuribacillus alkaliarsenatis TaxID=766136 RepID=A0A1E5G6D2_9FIRM|nr:N-acetyl-alpha-D-glucosaminyl L-malate synthase BshA [Desulfuribacillus alkaliarsenatis]OEF98740.1 N-acetyl-alpha-D-glucosaminyl L-malate synthase BshA [Desulfuribacillus alkaliarsenatis]
MNVGILCYPSVGGSGVLASQLANHLANRGHNIHVITYDKPFKLKEDKNIYFHKVTTNNYDLFKYPPYDFALVNKIVDVYHEYNLDLIHVHYAIPHVISAYLAKQMLSKHKDIKIITTLHGTDASIMGYDKSIRGLLEFGLEQSDAITAVSQNLALEAANVFSIDKEIITIYNFVDSNEYASAKCTQHLRQQFADNDEKIIIHVSNLRAVKRPLDLIDVYLMLKKNLNCKLLIVGVEANGKQLKELIDTYNLCNDVFLLDCKYDIQSLLAISDLFLLTSEKESFGLAALEAMATGLPVVATDTGGLPELIIDGETGCLAPVGDIQLLADLCMRILTDSNLYNKLSLQAKERAVDTFNHEKIITEYEQLYFDVLNRK